MFRLVKACFWLGLVIYFLPETGPANRPAAPLAAVPSASELAGAVAERAAGLCRDNPAACVEGMRLVGQAVQGQAAQGQAAQSQAAQSQAAQGPSVPGEATSAEATVSDTARRPARDTLTPADLAVPFGGVTAPVGSAPRRAPLPPRRPA